MNALFQSHRLNNHGLANAQLLGRAFDELLTKVESIVKSAGTTAAPAESGRSLAIARTKLEEACFFAKKSMAQLPENQEYPDMESLTYRIGEGGRAIPAELVEKF